MKRITSILLSVLLIISLTVTSFAQVDVNIDTNKNNVTIQGTTDYNNKPVTIQISDGKKKVYFDQEGTNNNGDFNFKTQLELNKSYEGHVLIEGEKQNFTFETKEDERTDEEKIKETVDKLKEHYKNKDEFTFREAIAYYASSNNKEADLSIIESKFKEKENLRFATDYANNIIGLIAGNVNPNEYKDGKYITELINAQKPSGIFELNGEGGECTQTAWSIIALDMAKAEYNVKEGVKALIKFQKNGSFEDLDSTAMCVMALSRHTDIEGVSDSIKEAKDFLLKNKEHIINDGNVCTISAVIQGLISIGENPLCKDWTFNNKNMMNALLAYQKGDTFGDNMNTEQAFMALVDLHNKKSMFEVEKTTSLCIEGYNGVILPETELEVKEGDTVISLTKKILDSKDIKYEENNGYISSIDGQAEFDKGSKSGWHYYVNGKQPSIGPNLINVNEGDKIKWVYVSGGEETNKQKIKEAIDDLRKYYEDKDFTFREAIGYRYTSDDIENDIKLIQSKYKVIENPSNASEYAGNIIGLISSGKNPRDYNGKDYVKTLLESQNKDGKFIINGKDDLPTTAAFSIIALDMVEAEYNMEGAIKALMSYKNEDGSFGPYKDIDTIAMSIMALGKHKDIEGVQSCIDDSIENIKSKQEDTGGFNAFGAPNPYSTAAVIQCLIAVGEDPLSEKWTKNKKTMLDSLLSFKKGDHFENTSEWGTEIDSVTEQAFMALADLDRGKSMYHELKYKGPAKVLIDDLANTTIKVNDALKLTAKVLNEDNSIITTENILWESSDENIAVVDANGTVTARAEGNVTITAKLSDNESILDSIELKIEPIEIKDFEITRIGSEEFENGNEAKIEVKVKNNSNKEKTATLMVVLYDTDAKRMINYSYAVESINSGESKKMGGAFLLPEKGNYEVRSFVWDDLDNQEVISTTPVIVEVKN